MSITMQGATRGSLEQIIEALGEWQHTGGPVQLHPGDLGWNCRLGVQELIDAVRVWSRDGQFMAVAMVDDAGGLARMGISPGVDQDSGFAARLLADLSEQGVQAVEARYGAAFRDLLGRSGWVADEPWTPLARDLTDEVEDCRLRIETIEADHIRERIVADRVAVQRVMFPHSTFTVERWRTMAAAPPYRRARCLVGYNGAGDAVATTTVWSAGEGRPGLIEPLGAHPEHRGHGHGRAITLAAAGALREMGASTATVCTPSSNVGAVAAYASAGFQKLPDATDFRRPKDER